MKNTHDLLPDIKLLMADYCNSKNLGISQMACRRVSVNIWVRLPEKGIKQLKQWEDIPIRIYVKWHWYFRYWQAKLQCVYPRQSVELTRRDHELVDETEVRLYYLNNKLKATKASITKITLRMNQAKAEWNMLFPIEDQDEWKKAADKLSNLRKPKLTLKHSLII